MYYQFDLIKTSKDQDGKCYGQVEGRFTILGPQTLGKGGGLVDMFCEDLETCRVQVSWTWKIMTAVTITTQTSLTDNSNVAGHTWELIHFDAIQAF